MIAPRIRELSQPPLRLHASLPARSLAWLLLMFAVAPARGDDSPLALTDLADYRRALVARGDKEPHPTVVSFRKLWDHPARYQGKRIQVEGRIVRRFRQGAVGTFPPLVEAWAVTPGGDPFCWVYPAPANQAPTVRERQREPVRFVGTYLRRIRYQGADVDRLAPLIVGPHPPTTPPRALRPKPRSGYSTADWLLGGTAAGVVLAVLTWQHLKKPVTRTSILESGPAPRFDGITPPEPDPLVQEETQDDSSDDQVR